VSVCVCVCVCVCECVFASSIAESVKIFFMKLGSNTYHRRINNRRIFKFITDNKRSNNNNNNNNKIIIIIIIIINQVIYVLSGCWISAPELILNCFIAYLFCFFSVLSCVFVLFCILFVLLCWLCNWHLCC
jgi:uncharacterized membrane protein YbaN (DUF454 family)